MHFSVNHLLLIPWFSFLREAMRGYWSLRAPLEVPGSWGRPGKVELCPPTPVTTEQLPSLPPCLPVYVFEVALKFSFGEEVSEGPMEAAEESLVCVVSSRSQWGLWVECWGLRRCFFLPSEPQIGSVLRPKLCPLTHSLALWGNETWYHEWAQAL